MIHPEQRKQRKRKHSDSKSTVADDDFYKRKNALLDKEEADYDEEVINAESEEDQEDELNVSRPFNMKKFREKLREGDFITGE